MYKKTISPIPTSAINATRWAYLSANSFLILLGFVYISIGALVTETEYQIYAPVHDVKVEGIILICQGTLMVVLFGSFIGLAYKRKVLKLYVILVSVYLLYLMIKTIALFYEIMSESYKFEFHKKVDHVFRTFNYDRHSFKIVNEMQSKFGCCGLNGPEFWSNIIPTSCCLSPFDCINIYKTGCIKILEKVNLMLYGIIGGIGLCTGLFCFFGVLFAVRLIFLIPSGANV